MTNLILYSNFNDYQQKNGVKIILWALLVVSLNGCTGSGLNVDAILPDSFASTADAGIKQNAKDFNEYIKSGTTSLLSAFSEVSSAIGDKEKAVKISGAAEVFNEREISKDSWKTVVEVIDSTNINLEDLARVDAATARAHIVESYINFSFASYFDKKATDTGTKVLESNPTMSPSLLGNVRTAIDVASTASEVLPKHIAVSNAWLAGLNSYMKNNNITVTKEEFRAAADRHGFSVNDEDWNILYPTEQTVASMLHYLDVIIVYS